MNERYFHPSLTFGVPNRRHSRLSSLCILIPGIIPSSTVTILDVSLRTVTYCDSYNIDTHFSLAMGLHLSGKNLNQTTSRLRNFHVSAWYYRHFTMRYIGRIWNSFTLLSLFAVLVHCSDQFWCYICLACTFITRFVTKYATNARRVRPRG